MPTPAPSDPVPHPADAPAYQYDETLEVSYSASLCCNNLSVAPSDGSQFHYSFVHKFGVVTGNQQASADVLKKPWTPVPNVPPGAVLLSMTVFQTKTFMYDGKPILIALSTHGAYIAFGEDMEGIPGYTVMEPDSKTEWSMYISVEVIGDDVICIGNCIGQIVVLQMRKPTVDDIGLLGTLHTTSRGKIILIKAEKKGIAAVDTLGKVWTWSLERTPLLKGTSTGLTNMATSLALTDNLIVLGFSHGALRLYFRDTGTLYCEVNAHASAVTALTFCPSISTLLTAGEDSFVRIWRIEEHQKDFKLEHIDNEYVEDVLLCGVDFLDNDGARFAVTGYDRNELIIYRRGPPSSMPDHGNLSAIQI